MSHRVSPVTVSLDGSHSEGGLSRDSVDEIARSGWFVVECADTAPTVFASLNQVTAAFFRQSRLVKERASTDLPSRYLGWAEPGRVGGSNTAETLALPAPGDSSQPLDPDRVAVSAQVRSRWPELVEAWREYSLLAERAARLGMTLFSDHLGLTPGWVDNTFANHESGMVANWYQPVGEPSFRQHAHADFGPVTVLTADGGPGGLELSTGGGHWAPVETYPGQLVVQFGTLAEQWSGGRWRAVPHRVVARRATTVPRLSLAYFFVPPSGTSTAPLVGGYDEKSQGTSGEFLKAIERTHTPPK